ncbi:hypothetical protein [Psychrobacillus sp.]|uniref:hypothetical protein n=1 Tax=Psychrobacillus sp. TaxID=1871623 RepID=UPI0028BE096D|nr:hypothetical protein [Psychrobacillus sp.]
MFNKRIPKIGGIFFLICSCFLFVGCSEENPEHQEVVISSEDKNIEAVQAVLESEFTVPNEEYLVIVKNIEKKMTDIGSRTPEANEVNGVEESGVSDEWRAYEDLVKKVYGPYFMDYAFDNLISSNIAFNYHYGYLGFDANIRYKMKVSDIQITKSDNINTPKFYDFTAQVEYTNSAGEVSQHEVKGAAILSEPGKIGKFEIRDDGGLGQQGQ